MEHMNKSCTRNKCLRKYHAKGFCQLHYREEHNKNPKIRNRINKMFLRAHYTRMKDPEFREKNKKLMREISTRHRHTFLGMLSQMWHKMLYRTSNKQQSESTKKLYLGRFCPKKKDFMEKALSDSNIYCLWKTWMLSGYEKDLKPSPDRMITEPNPKTGFTGGYELHNIQFVTWKQNREFAHIKRQLNSKKAIYQLVGKIMQVPGKNKLSKKHRPGQKEAIHNLVDVRSKNEK